MPGRQLKLFAVARPLLERLGEKYFRGAPRGPGVYIMTGRHEQVLYIGQSKDLRARLGSYKNSQPGSAPRKVSRLVQAVERITWEKCDSAEAARLRENELLRLHRPSFNALNTWPAAYPFLWLRSEEGRLEFGRTNSLDGAPASCRMYGAFKGGAVSACGALLRSVWAALNQPHSPYDFPRQLLGNKGPRQYVLPLPTPARAQASGTLIPALCNFLEGSSEQLLESLSNALPTADSISRFQRALHAKDLEILAQFYRTGPRRNHELRLRHNLPGPLILQAQLDDLLALDIGRSSELRQSLGAAGISGGGVPDLPGSQRHRQSPLAPPLPNDDYQDAGKAIA